MTSNQQGRTLTAWPHLGVPLLSSTVRMGGFLRTCRRPEARAGGSFSAGPEAVWREQGQAWVRSNFTAVDPNLGSSAPAPPAQKWGSQLQGPLSLGVLHLVQRRPTGTLPGPDLLWALGCPQGHHRQMEMLTWWMQTGLPTT